MTKTDEIYCNLIEDIMLNGEQVSGRNGNTLRSFTLPTVVFNSTPLVTVRKTAWRKAIREMEWFLSGHPKCPDEILDWWEGQLNKQNFYNAGYGEQFRKFLGADSEYDQIAALLDGLRSHPFSRRHIITAWNPLDMSIITKLNNNERTPTTCHSTIVQFFVSDPGLLSMHSYQRSADMLLGVPHNWIQSWALLLWLCKQTDTFPGKMLWTFGDAHLYKHSSHMQTVDQLLAIKLPLAHITPRLIYNGGINSDFHAADFEMIGTVPEPIVLIKPKLL